MSKSLLLLVDEAVMITTAERKMAINIHRIHRSAIAEVSLFNPQKGLLLLNLANLKIYTETSFCPVACNAIFAEQELLLRLQLSNECAEHIGMNHLELGSFWQLILQKKAIGRDKVVHIVGQSIANMKNVCRHHSHIFIFIN